MFSNTGKQVFYGSAHLADATNADSAELMVAALNASPFGFDYMAEADKTCSTHFRPHNVGRGELLAVLRDISAVCDRLDKFKKLLFRGKDRVAVGFEDLAEDDTKLDDFIHSVDFPSGMVDVLHGAIGGITEAGEVADYLIRWLVEGKLDAVNVMEESGDMLWYIVRSMRGVDRTLEQCQKANIDKLHGRHGEAFDIFRDANRDLSAERVKLEDSFAHKGPTLLDVEVVKNPPKFYGEAKPVDDFHKDGVAVLNETHTRRPAGDCEGMDC